MYTHTCKHTHTRTRMQAHTHTHTHTRTCMQAHTHTHTHTHAHACKHTHTHTHTHAHLPTTYNSLVCAPFKCLEITHIFTRTRKITPAFMFMLVCMYITCTTHFQCLHLPYMHGNKRTPGSVYIPRHGNYTLPSCKYGSLESCLTGIIQERMCTTDRAKASVEGNWVCVNCVGSHTSCFWRVFNSCLRKGKGFLNDCVCVCGPAIL